MSLPRSDVAKLATWDAVETRERVRRRDVTAREVAEAAIARAEEAAHLGAAVVMSVERALAAADRPASAPLAGVPTFVKDLAQLRGVATGWGSRGTGTYVSRKSDVFVERFEGCGLVVLGKSATPELGLTATTEPMGRPPSRNPWDPSRSSGGSSGGAGSLVAAGVVPIAHASDGGGSIRVPAACCGLVGLKPSRFRIDMHGSNLLPINVATDGVLTRSVRDTVAFYEALESLWPPRKVPPIGDVASAPRPLRIGLYVDAPTGTSVDAEVQAAVMATGRACRDLGHVVEEIPCPFEASFIDDFLKCWGFLAWLQTRSARVMLHRGFDASRVEPWTVGLVKTFTSQRRVVLEAIMRLRGFARTFAAVMQRWDVLLSPTTAAPAPPLGHIAPDGDFDTVYARLRTYCAFTPMHNAAGAPAISLPLGRSEGGLPIGVQLAAAHGGDRTLLELALSLEAAHPWERLAPRSAWASAAG